MKKTENIALKTSQLNDCTNHLSFQLEQNEMKKKLSKKKVDSLYEAPLADIITDEFIRGYN